MYTQPVYRFFLFPLCSIMLTVACASYAWAANLDIGVVTDTHPKLTDELQERLHVVSQSLQVKLRVFTVANLSHSENIGLYIAVGARALDELLKQKLPGDILTVYVSRTSYNKVVQRHQLEAYTNRLHVIYSDPEPIAQLALIKQLLPKGSDTAVILSDATRFLETSLRHAANELGINLRVVTHDSKADIFVTLRRIPKHVSLLAIPDPTIYNSKTIHNIIASSYRNHRFIFGYSKHFVDAGGLASITYSNADILAVLEDNIRIQYVRKPNSGVSTRPRFLIAINKSVAHSFNLVLPPIDDIRDEIQSMLETCCEQ